MLCFLRFGSHFSPFVALISALLIVEKLLNLSCPNVNANVSQTKFPLDRVKGWQDANGAKTGQMFEFSFWNDSQQPRAWRNDPLLPRKKNMNTA